MKQKRLYIGFGAYIYTIILFLFATFFVLRSNQPCNVAHRIYEEFSHNNRFDSFDRFYNEYAFLDLPIGGSFHRLTLIDPDSLEVHEHHFVINVFGVTREHQTLHVGSALSVESFKGQYLNPPPIYCNADDAP